MKLIHLSDLHIGKRVNEFSMIEDQEYILKKIIAVIDEAKPDGIMIAGDVYDKSVPSTEAISLFDDFLVKLADRNLMVFIISGNHDSPERLSFGSRLMEHRGVYLSRAYDGQVRCVSMEDDYGLLRIHMLPFIKPAHVRRYYPETDITTYTEALQTVIDHLEIHPQDRNIIMTHQFVTGAKRCESEEVSVGGTDNVDVEVFNPFDYVALGHIHSPQSAGRKTVRYCGTPLKYSISEADHKKSVTIVEFGAKGEVRITAVPLTPMRDLRKIKGSYMEITNQDYYGQMNREDYLHITLTDEEDIPYAIGKLRAIYPNIMKLDYDNERTRQGLLVPEMEEREKKTPGELFADFFISQNGRPMSAEQDEFLSDMITRIWEGEG